MEILTYATCSMCKEWIDDKRNPSYGSCATAEAAAKEGMIQAGIAAPDSLHISLPCDAKPCDEWEPSAEGQREIDAYEADHDETTGKPPRLPGRYDWERALGLGEVRP